MKIKPAHKKRAGLLVGLAEVCGTELSETRLRSYLGTLEDLSDEEFAKAYNTIVNEPKLFKFPLPGQIRQAARPQLDAKQEAIRRVEMIQLAIRRFGYMCPEEAKDYLGEVWEDVQRLGGWEHVCTSPDSDLNNPVIYAQVRDRVSSSVSGDRIGIESSKDILNRIGGKNETDR